MISKKKKNIKYKLQTECIKTLTKKNKNYPQNGLYTKYSLLPFPILIIQELIKLGYKISKNYLPRPITNLYKKEGRKQHKYPTRRKEIPNVQRHTDHHFNISFMCKSLMYYSELPGITRNIKHFNKFKIELKKYLLNNIHE